MSESQCRPPKPSTRMTSPIFLSANLSDYWNIFPIACLSAFVSLYLQFDNTLLRIRPEVRLRDCAVTQHDTRGSSVGLTGADLAPCCINPGNKICKLRPAERSDNEILTQALSPQYRSSTTPRRSFLHFPRHTPAKAQSQSQSTGKRK